MGDVELKKIFSGDDDSGFAADGGGVDQRVAPQYLSEASRELWDYFVSNYEFERHQLETLKDALRAKDRAWQAKIQLDQDGLTIADRFGKPKKHPAVDIEKEYIKLASNLFLSLGLDYEPLNDRPGRPAQAQQLNFLD